MEGKLDVEKFEELVTADCIEEKEAIPIIRTNDALGEMFFYSGNFSSLRDGLP